MLASSANQLSASIAGTAAGGAGAALAGAAALSTTLGGPPAPPTGKAAAACYSSTSAAVAAAAGGLTCVSFMRHSIATHNEAAAASADAMGSVYLSEAYADSRYTAGSTPVNKSASWVVGKTSLQE